MLHFNGITHWLWVKDSILAYQYADDTVLIAEPTITVLVSLKIIIRLFASVSGLHINYKKSSFIPINVSEQDHQWMERVLGCSRTKFPISYLGMPLSINKPKKEHFGPLIEKMERRLGGWMTKIISRGGGAVAINSIGTFHHSNLSHELF